jgi:hypothetical protein
LERFVDKLILFANRNVPKHTGIHLV